MTREPKKISMKVVPRLSQYYRIIYDRDSKDMVSSNDLSVATGFTAAQVRKDLTYFGQFGYPGKGYNVGELKGSLKRILGLDRRWRVAIIGTGNLGMALLGYRGFREQGFEIVAAFDFDKRKTGRVINGVKVFDIGQLRRVLEKNGINMALLTIPRNSAQNTADELVKCGIKAILNFAPVNLKLPSGVKARNIDMSMELESLSFLSVQNGEQE
ncbi:MAG: redox-sensing transcriptional repressor Rex [Endomicrobiales bacterium]|nr:redox-sensing transcriptional repressor Rex [Endomicrobiales bacterium]